MSRETPVVGDVYEVPVPWGDTAVGTVRAVLAGQASDGPARNLDGERTVVVALRNRDRTYYLDARRFENEAERRGS